jgi:hypothetical protein
MLGRALISSTSLTGITLLNIKFIVLNQCSNKSILFSPRKKSDFMNTEIKNRNEERRKVVENIFLEIVASLFVGSLVFICFWILFKSR